MRETPLSLVKRRLYGHAEEGRTIARVDLRNARAGGSKWKSCTFQNANLSASDFVNSDFEDCRFEACQMTLANFFACRFTKCLFVDCTLDQANFAGTVITDTYFDDCRLPYASFLDATLRKNVSFTSCGFHGADLGFLESETLQIFDCNLWGAKIPMGCAFWNAELDSTEIRQFLAIIARQKFRFLEPLKEMAEDQVKVIDRLMRREDEHDKP